jgi:hypothetical protein
MFRGCIEAAALQGLRSLRHLTCKSWTHGVPHDSKSRLAGPASLCKAERDTEPLKYHAGNQDSPNSNGFRPLGLTAIGSNPSPAHHGLVLPVHHQREDTEAGWRRGWSRQRPLLVVAALLSVGDLRPAKLSSVFCPRLARGVAPMKPLIESRSVESVAILSFPATHRGGLSSPGLWPDLYGRSTSGSRIRDTGAILFCTSQSCVPLCQAHRYLSSS